MSKYDEFDLDVQNLKDNENSQEKGISTAILSVVTGSVVTGCSDNCLTVGCTKGCSKSCYRSECPPC